MSADGSPWDHLAARDFTAAGPVQRFGRAAAAWAPTSWVLARTLHHLDRPVSRLTRGRSTATSLMTGLTVAVLTTRGRRSGRARESPLIGFPLDDGFVVIASNYGQSRHPTWYHNLLADPAAELLVGGSLYPGWDAYARRPARDIGVFLLTVR